MNKSLLKLLHEACGLILLMVTLVSEIRLAVLHCPCTAEASAGSDCLAWWDLAALLMKV